MTSHPQGPAAEDQHPDLGQAFEPKVTSSTAPALQSLIDFTWGTAGVYAGFQTVVVIADYVNGFTYGNSLIGLAIGLLVFALVATLLKRRSATGRVLGIIFSLLALAVSGMSFFAAFAYPQPWSVLVAVVSVIWFACSVIWIAKSFNTKITEAFATR